MSKPKVLIAVPMLHETKAEFVVSLLGLQTNTCDVQISMKIGSLVYNARNYLAMKAFTDECDYVFWLDSDMTFVPETLSMLLQDAEQGMDYVTGLCFSRQLPTNPVIAKSITWERDEKSGIVTHDAELYKDYPRDQVFEIAGSGMACCLMKTSLLGDVAESFRLSPFYPMPLLGEDYSFCWRLGKLGVKMYCDSRVKCGHIGAFNFNEEVYLKQEQQA